MASNPDEILAAVGVIADAFRDARAERVGRRRLDRADFEALAATGLPLLAVPTANGGFFRSVSESVRPICEAHRRLARGDASVALVASMHPAVLVFWLATPEVPAGDTAAWQAQRNRIFARIHEGAWWGTISSEPGSGGDHARTTSGAAKEGDDWRVTGSKHFGSGSGITSYMLTTAVPKGEAEPDWFFVDTSSTTWDGSDGITLVREWDGRGMRATQSHAMRFEGVAAERIAWPGHLAELRANSGLFGPTLFTSVIVGIVDESIEMATRRLAGRPLRTFEQVEWAEARLEAWTLVQVYEGMLRAAESGDDPVTGIRGKVAAARLAESSLQRLCRVMGGSTFSEASPFGQSLEDVRALGFLRPPWGLAYESLIDPS